MMWWNGGSGWVGWLLMSTGLAAFLVLVFRWLTALLPGVGEIQAERLRTLEPQDALRILDERLARGELEVQEYQACRRRIHGADDKQAPQTL